MQMHRWHRMLCQDPPPSAMHRIREAMTNPVLDKTFDGPRSARLVSENHRFTWFATLGVSKVMGFSCCFHHRSRVIRLLAFDSPQFAALALHTLQPIQEEVAQELGRGKFGNIHFARVCHTANGPSGWPAFLCLLLAERERFLLRMLWAAAPAM